MNLKLTFWVIGALLLISLVLPVNFIFLASGAQPVQQTSAPEMPLTAEIVDAAGDAIVDLIEPDFAYGSLTGLGVGYDHTLDFFQWRTLVRFDLNGIPPDTVISEARLQLYLTGGSPGGENVPLEIARMTEDWDEADVTWNNGGQDTIVDLIPAVTREVGTLSGWVEWDVTALVQSWLDGDFPNYGLVVHGPEWVTEYGRSFASREAAVGAGRPGSRTARNDTKGWGTWRTIG